MLTSVFYYYVWTGLRLIYKTMIDSILKKQMSSEWSCDAHREDEGDGVDRNEQAGGESGQMMRAAHGSAHAGLGERIHAVRPPLTGALAEILTQRGEDGHLEPDPIRISGAAARAHVYIVLTRGVIGPDREHRAEEKD